MARLIKRLRVWFYKSETRIRIAWAQIRVTVIGCPLTMIFTSEPKFILGLSWWAILSTAFDTLNTTEIKKEVG